MNLPAPLALERAADEIVEVQEQKEPQPARLRDEHKGDYPPHLAAEHRRRVEGEVALYHAGGVHGAEQPDREGAEDDIQHEVVHAEPGVLVAEQVHPFHESAHMLYLRGEIIW